MRRRKEKASTGPPPPGSWLTTYSDMVTLLLCFFVVLFSMASVDVEKFQAMVISLQSAFGVLGGRTAIEGPGVEGATILPEPGSTVIDMSQITELYHDIQSFLIEEGIADMVEAVLEERGVIIRFRDSVLFDTGRADIRPDGARIIDTIATYLVRIPNHVRIEGHADNVPIRNARYPSNWELSTARATSVIRYLLTKTDISPERLSAAGYGEYRPVAPNDTPENRARNRRVDLVLLRLDLNALEPN